MQTLNIEPDPAPVNRRTRRCIVCGKLWSFKLHNTVPHQMIGRSKKGAESNQFCPLANDHGILKNYSLEKRRKRAASKKERRMNKMAAGM